MVEENQECFTHFHYDPSRDRKTVHVMICLLAFVVDSVFSISCEKETSTGVQQGRNGEPILCWAGGAGLTWSPVALIP